MGEQNDSSLRERSKEFVDYLDDWFAGLENASLAEIIDEASGPDHVAIFCVDIINGFCHEGPLHGDRVKALIPPIAALFAAAHDAGIRDFVLTHDAHTPNAVEFGFYPPHCIQGDSQSQLVPELSALPFSNLFTPIAKNSIHSGYGTTLDPWLVEHQQITHRIVVGDCTDLCTYQLVMQLHLADVAADRVKPVIVPVNCVDTFDVPVTLAKSLGIPAHSADLLHVMFLYNMACNGVRTVKRLA